MQCFVFSDRQDFPLAESDLILIYFQQHFLFTGKVHT